MRDKIINALKSPAGMVGLGIVGLAVVVFLVLRVADFFGGSAVIRSDVRLMNPDTGEMRWAKVGTSAPNGFHPVEYCFNNQCGELGGTPVILNLYLGDRQTPTTCPVCGAPVVAHNPRPEGYENAVPADW